MYDNESMKRLPVLGLILATVFLASATFVFATSAQARQDYLYQFDLYRQRYTDFQVAKNEYEKFNTLTSQTTALQKTKAMLGQRDQLLHAYLLLLLEKLNEESGLSATTKQLYRSLIASELTFLEGHAQLIPSIGSIEDAVQVSSELESHYRVLQTSIRQILIGLSLGQLSILGQMYDTATRDSQSLIVASAGYFTPAKQEVVNRWVLQVSNKRSLFQQKYDAISSANALLQSRDSEDLERQYSDITKLIAEARQYLLEGASFLTELKNALKYVN